MTTREDMAKALINYAHFDGQMAGLEFEEIAAELRKTCATCKWFDEYSSECGNPQGLLNTDDGSGFCHRWEAKK